MMRHELDEEPVLIDTKMSITCVKWSPNGEVLGVVGSEKPEALANFESRLSVQLYSHYGIHLRTLHVPGKKISTLAWEGGGLKLALAVDSYIYLANIRPEYKWTFFNGSTCVYGFQKKGSEDYCIIFWNVSNGERHSKFVKGLLGICGNEEYCTIATMGNESEQYLLSLCNSFGQCVAFKTTNVEPQFLSMNHNFVFVSSENSVCSWDYRSYLSSFSTERASGISTTSFKADDSQTFHLDSHVRLAPFPGNGDGIKDSTDQISCVCSSKDFLLVGRDSGILHRFILPHLSLQSTDLLQCRPQAMELNCSSTRLAVIDMNGILKFYDMKNETHKKQEKGEGITALDFERKDVWNMKWADDNADLLAVMEKARMYILRGTELEEPVSCTAYLCRFHALQIQAVQLDEIMQQPETPGKQHLFYYETKSLRDTQQILEATQLQDAFSYIEEHSHPRLWTTLAEHALRKLDLSITEKAFVRCKDYFGIQFVKRVHSLKEPNEQRAEVCAYFKRFDEAEKLLLQIKRVDLALNLHIKFGRWCALEKLVISHLEDDSVMQLTYDSMGKFFLERQNWKEAKKFYERSKNNACIAHCLYKLGDWKTLEGLMRSLKKDDPLLLCIANQFWSVGMCKQATAAFIQHGSTLAAIECCLDLNMWNMAFELGQKYDQEALVNNNFDQYIEYLLTCENHTLAIKAAENAQQYLRAAKLLKGFATKLIDKKVSSQTVKRAYVLMALNIEKWKAATKSLKAVNDEMEFVVEKPWHYAEANHLWGLVHQHLYLNNFEDAFHASIWLNEYEDILNLQRLYSLQAVASYQVNRFQECERAFKNLDQTKTLTNDAKEKLESLSSHIFCDRNQLESCRSFECICKECKSSIQVKDKKCSTCDYQYHVCVASGHLIIDEDFLICDICKHFIKSSRACDYHHCPLCHGDLGIAKAAKPMYKHHKRKIIR